MDTVFLALRVLVSLAAVLAVIWFAHRWITGGAKARPKGRHITVIAKQSLGAKASVAVVETDGKRFLLGVTEHAVTVLDSAPIPPELVAVQTTPIPVGSFQRALAAARSAPQPPSVREPVALEPATRRAAREAQAARTSRSPVAGSLLSADTWRQTATALRRAR
ncbi:MAG: hypothetical protein JWR33_1722 [Naasia sp.]|jgi:flagellar protein FliO/FliZ|uniref:flagellar biosynthetic protein FliO n=1 Tax=Naasia sp. TaxID=2546198 RepID=UPI002611CF81|nr:flagellar biosynthetic protein FliO [Naasia sp.]MCU1570981.1 hypothetical protein [Naasia sp.]